MSKKICIFGLDYFKDSYALNPLTVHECWTKRVWCHSESGSRPATNRIKSIQWSFFHNSDAAMLEPDKVSKYWWVQVGLRSRFCGKHSQEWACWMSTTHLRASLGNLFFSFLIFLTKQMRAESLWCWTGFTITNRGILYFVSICINNFCCCYIL